MRTHPIERYQVLRDSAPRLSRAATPPEGHQIGARTRRAPGNTILSQPYRRRVSTDRLNREGSQLAASLEVEPGPTPAGKTLPHSYPETRFRRERARVCIYKHQLVQVHNHWSPKVPVSCEVRSTTILLYDYASPDQWKQTAVLYTVLVCCVIIPFILDVRLVDAPAGVTQGEGHTDFLHLPSAVLALIFIARMIQPSYSLADCQVEFCVPMN